MLYALPKMVSQGSHISPGSEPESVPTDGSRDTSTKKNVNREKLDISTPAGSSGKLTPGLVDRLTMLKLGSRSTASNPANNHQPLTSNTATSGGSGAFAESSTGGLSAAVKRSCRQQNDHENEEPSLMEQMMAEAMAAREAKAKKEQKKNRDRAKKDFAGGLKKGFLGGGSPAVARKHKTTKGKHCCGQEVAVYVV